MTTLSIPRMIALDFQSCDFVENKGFVELVHYRQARYNSPHRNTFSMLRTGMRLTKAKPMKHHLHRSMLPQ